MRLIWKVLRQNISIGQLSGFVLANIIGLTIIVLGLQLYLDLQPLLSNKSGFMKADYWVISKPVSTMESLAGVKPAFTSEEIDDIESQEFIAQVGFFTPALYTIKGQVIMEKYGVDVGTDLFFEAVPEEFVDIQSEEWTFQPGDEIIPIVVPQDYLNLYNFGYAPSADFPAISEAMIQKVLIDLYLIGNGKQLCMKGKIVGFSSRLNTILVPQSFMEWSNQLLADGYASKEVSRIIVQVTNPADERIVPYFKNKGLDIERDKLDTAKVGWLMRVLVFVVMLIGLIICGLAGYVLILSIFLLLQRNKTVIRNLMIIGYQPKQIAIPYSLLVAFTNFLSLFIAVLFLIGIRTIYLRYFYELSADYRPESITLVLVVTFAFELLITCLNARLILSSIRKTF